MGNYSSKFISASNSVVNSVYRNRKRKYIEDDELDDYENRFIERTMQTPKRRKLLTTAQYIYKTLFLEGKASDITVLMLGKAWKLHKVYINQSPYFESMFSGSWREANEKVVRVEISDSMITLESLSVVLGSFYLDEVSLEPKNVISIVATATLFQLQDLIDQCTEIMAETTNIQTVIPYYDAGTSYGILKVKIACKKWLEVNLMGHCWLFNSFLKQVTPELMAELVESSNLVAMQTEFCIYMMLRNWLYIHLQSDQVVTIEDFYRKHTWTQAFLSTKEGKEFSKPFKALRKKYLILNYEDVQILRHDNLIPKDWLNDAYEEQWLHILKVDSNRDAGFPSSIPLIQLLKIRKLRLNPQLKHNRPEHLSEEEFARECFRCGRCIDKPGEHVWRWTAFNFGLDFVVTLHETSLKFKRYDRDCHHIKANHMKHQIMLKVCLISLNKQRQIKHMQSSGIVRLSLQKNEEKQVMCVDSDLTYPLYVSVNMQVVTPLVSRENEIDKNVTVILDT